MVDRYIVDRCLSVCIVFSPLPNSPEKEIGEKLRLTVFRETKQTETKRDLLHMQE